MEESGERVPRVLPEPALEPMLCAEGAFGVRELAAGLVRPKKDGDQRRVPVIRHKGDVLAVGEQEAPGGLDGGLAKI